MKIIIDVNYCPECEELSCELTASTEAFDYMESTLFLETISDVSDVVEAIIGHYVLDHDVKRFLDTDQLPSRKGGIYETT